MKTSNARGEWVLVPRVPTEEMEHEGIGVADWTGDVKVIWSAMLAAAPPPAAAQKQRQLNVGSPRTPEQIAATVAWVQSLADSDITPQPTQQGSGEVEAALETLWRAVDKADRNMWGDVEQLRTAAGVLTRALAQQPAAVDGAMVAKLTEGQRTRLVEKLVSDQVESANRVSLYLWDVLESGFKGYANYTDQELLDAHSSAFDEDFLDLESGELQ